MHLNLAVLCGSLAAPPEYRRFESGATQLRLLLAVRSDTPARRVDLIPVILWDPPDSLLERSLTTGATVWASGMLRSRFWGHNDNGERRSGIEVVAQEVTVRHPDFDLVEV